MALRAWCRNIRRLINTQRIAAIDEATIEAVDVILPMSRAADAVVIKASGYGSAKAGVATDSAQPARVSRNMMLIVEAKDSALAAMAWVRVIIAHTANVIGTPRKR